MQSQAQVQSGGACGALVDYDPAGHFCELGHGAEVAEEHRGHQLGVADLDGVARDRVTAAVPDMAMAAATMSARRASAVGARCSVAASRAAGL